VTLDDVLQLPALKVGRLLTSQENTQGREILGASVIEVPVGEFVRPGELVMSTGMNVGQDVELLNHFITEVARAGASALAIAIGPYTPNVFKRAIGVANRLRLPLIALPWEIRFSEISEAILRQLIQETERRRSLDDFVWSLASRNINEDTAITQGKEFGFDIGLKLAGVVGKLSRFVTGQSEQMQINVRFVECLCRSAAEGNQLHWFGTIVGDSVIGFLQQPRKRQRLQSILAALQPLAGDTCTISWGVGRVCKEFTDFQKSYEDARIACDLGMRTRGEGSVTDVSDVLADRLLLTLQHDSGAWALLERYVEPLRRVQRMPLLATLETFFENDCNSSETARKLAISRQSLLYRLEKIETTLNVDLHNAEHRFAMALSLRLCRLR
jgi:sugar diacid utilization regulator